MTIHRHILFSIVFLFLFACSPYAASSKPVTVAYIDYNRFIEKSPDGVYRGYAADYLMRIAEYTGHQYKFVEMDWPSAFQAVKEGRVDFYCVARQKDDRYAGFDFSLYPICNEEMNLYTLPTRKIYYEDYGALNGLKIGMLAGSVEIDNLRQYADKHGFQFELVEYPMNEQVIAALNAGDVDVIGVVNYSVNENLKLIGNFGVSPAYMMSCDGSQYMKEFCSAQEKLFFNSPDFVSELEKKYYGDKHKNNDLLLTRDEVDYLAQCPVLTVAVSVDMAPIEYYDEDKKEFHGLTVDLYNRISELTGLQFRFVPRQDVLHLLSQMEKGNVQLIGAMAQSEQVASTLRLTQTKPFSQSSFSIVTKDFSKLSTNSIAAIPVGYPMFSNAAKEHGYTNLVNYDSLDASIRAVYDGAADLTYMISMCEVYLLGHIRYTDMRSMILNGSEYNICLGVTDAYDSPLLLSVINKCLSVISKREISEMIVENTAMAKPKQTFADFCFQNGLTILFVGLSLISFLSIVIIIMLRSRQQRTLNENMRQSQIFLEHLYNTLPCGVLQYDYESPHTILNSNAACANIYGYEESDKFFIGKIPSDVVKSGTVDGFLSKFDLCVETAGPITYDWPITKKDGTESFVECVMDIVETSNGRVFQEVFIDVTERVRSQKRIEKRYMLERSHRGKRDEGLLYTICFDINDQIMMHGDIDIEGIEDGISINTFIDLLIPGLNGLQSDEEVDAIRERYTVQKMQAEYDIGKYEHSNILCRRNEGVLQWLRSDSVLCYNPSNGHLMCFDYIWDITDEHITSDIMRHLALADCESFMSIDVATGRCMQYIVDIVGDLIRSEKLYGKTDVIRQLEERMSESERDSFVSSTDLFEVTDYLSQHSHYQVYATLETVDGVRKDKALNYFYTDRANGILAVAVTDVTEVRRSEVIHAELLSDALAIAEKAGAAKSQFLSRMSHEMRTPLNAIIGFIELAKDADPEKVANCLASSDIAAKQLLSVINDVLDMSSIESGKMKIAVASFNFRHLVSSLTSIYGTQCRQKGIDFETKITTHVEDWLVGDELRVNQILMNLLGNAVKFTSHGHLWMSISQTVVDDNKIFIRFEISDTGCGMSEELKERLFKPFEQENAMTAKKFGGSGLGLSIVKNLVDIMSGSIRVESQIDKGTTFSIELPFLKSDIAQNDVLPHEIGHLRVLAIDDEESEREYISLILKRMGIQYTCVESGLEAMAALEQSTADNNPFNVCLIDWRMPVLSGLDTTRMIREKYGKDVVVIAVSAYDFQQAGISAREAGANMFLSKPIFQSSLFDLFMTLTGGAVSYQPESIAQTWDFVGKRVLLVEDNALNQIVAEGYLSKYNIVVDLVENGQIAVDKFLASEPGYYDAILMDIQMPVMDGFEATKLIRESNHPEARTIPIIAQSADAFNEDIAKCFAAGMNAHVAKPIKPDLLAKELHKVFSLDRASFEKESL